MSSLFSFKKLKLEIGRKIQYLRGEFSRECNIIFNNKQIELSESLLKIEKKSNEEMQFDELIEAELTFSKGLKQCVKSMEDVLTSSYFKDLENKECKQELENIQKSHEKTLEYSKKISPEFIHIFYGSYSLSIGDKIVKLTEIYKSDQFKGYVEAIKNCNSLYNKIKGEFRLILKDIKSYKKNDQEKDEDLKKEIHQLSGSMLALFNSPL